MSTKRFEILSRSDSGLNFVRERRSGVLRMLTESELADFSDPPPCPECAEQFGCEHRNYAGEPLLSEQEIEAVVPAQWRALALGHGLSSVDLGRLRALELSGEQFRAPAGADVRTLELLVLLNDER